MHATATERQIAGEKDGTDGDVLADLVAYLEERVIPRLSVSCEWKWVAVQLHRALARRV